MPQNATPSADALTPGQEKALSALLAGKSVTDAATAAEVDRTTMPHSSPQIVPRADVVAHISDELRATTGGGPPEAEHLPRLEYLDAVIRESLRLPSRLQIR